MTDSTLTDSAPGAPTPGDPVPTRYDFVLRTPRHRLQARGAQARYSNVAAAVAALADGAPLAVGALAFDPAADSALFTPVSWEFCDPAGDPAPPATLAELTVAGLHPGPQQHEQYVADLVAAIRAGRFDKVVAARSIEFDCVPAIDPAAYFGQLCARNPRANCFLVETGTSTFLGATPELLISKRGAQIQLYPLAGTVPRSADPETDHERGQALTKSAKNLAEHAFVVDWIRERLSPVCRELSVPSQPSLVAAEQMWHLGTPITGTLADPGTTSLELAALLHPTPAVCGSPAGPALREILRGEPDRRFYGGAAGWCDASGDGDWVVSIRCAELSSDGTRLRAWAGGGIVADSDPADELAETTTKLSVALASFALRDRGDSLNA